MSIRIATLSFGGFPGDLLGLEEGLDPTFLNTLLLPPLMLTGRPSGPSVRVPQPITTTSFPDRPAADPPVHPATTRAAKRRSSRRRARTDEDPVVRKKSRAGGGGPDGCAICLESLDAASPAAVLPCAHSYHRRCLFAVLTAPTLGSCSMVRCPLCRASVDRYDLAAMGYDVGPRRLARAQRRCGALFRLLTGGGTGIHAISSLVQQCGDTGLGVRTCIGADSPVQDGSH
jgi:hypothetical protein